MGIIREEQELTQERLTSPFDHRTVRTDTVAYNRSCTEDIGTVKQLQRWFQH